MRALGNPLNPANPWNPINPISPYYMGRRDDDAQETVEQPAEPVAPSEPVDIGPALAFVFGAVMFVAVLLWLLNRD